MPNSGAREEWKCQRCERIVTDYPALSRADVMVEVCSRCGVEEAMNQFSNKGWTQPVSDWPVRNASDLPNV